MPVWTPRQRPSSQSSTTEGSPIGLLLVLTYAVTTSSVQNIWGDRSRPSTTFTERSQQSTLWTRRESIGMIRDTEGGNQRITEGGNQRVTEGVSWETSSPSSSMWTNRVIP